MYALEVDSLTKRYGRTVAVDGVSFTVERGAVFGLLGPNGSGKTTTLACTLGLERPTRGRIRVLGLPATRLARTRGRVGTVFDAPILVRELTVRGQLAYARQLLGHRGGRTPEQALELAGIAPLAGRRVAHLSLGEQKRLAVAIALLGAPELLVLDEPLSGLDPLGVRAFLRLLRELAASGLTIVVSSHRLFEMEQVLTHAAILIAGRVTRIGSLGELLGAAERHRLVVDDLARAAEVIARSGALLRASESAAEGCVLRVELGSIEAAALNSALVGAGVRVHELGPERGGLPALFEALLDELDSDARRGGAE